LGGYRQPQQLSILAYLLSLGAHFDVVINLDGFNEIALPPMENIPQGTCPFFPRNWAITASSSPSHEMLASIGRITLLREKQRDWSAAMNHAPMRYSMTMNLLWYLYEMRLSRLIYESQIELASMKTSAGFQATGPTFSYDTDEELYQSLATVWMNSSLQMHHLCKANRILYWHFLQPNLSFSQSPLPLIADRQSSMRKESRYEQPIDKGHPILRQMGSNLVSRGVMFHDLTTVFDQCATPPYEDICHPTPAGHVILGEAIGDFIVRDLIHAERQEVTNP
jgi:hypothetical protein